MVNEVQELEAFKKSYALAMEVFRLTLKFPKEERYSLTSQIRRSSRSVSLNLCEAWAKRRYEPHFISKLTDCDGENLETATSLSFARDCGYIEPSVEEELIEQNREVGRLIGAMLKTPSTWTLNNPPKKSQ